MSPAGAIDFTVGETISQNLFKTASGDIGTITGRVVSVDTSNSKIIVDTIRPDHTAMKQLQSEDGRPGVFTLFKETSGDWTTDQSDTDIEFIHGIVGESSGKKASINVVADASTKTDQGSGQAFLVGETIT